MDIAAFLAARYAEREAVIGEPRTWTVEHHECDGWGPPCDRPCPEAAQCAEGRCGHCRIEGGSDGMTIYDEGGHDQADADHIAAYDPAWALADIAVKRQILAEHKRMNPGDCGTCNAPYGAPGWQRWPCRTVRLLASEFTGHPDYQEAWKP